MNSPKHRWSATSDAVLLHVQRRVLELIAEGRPLRDVLDALCRSIEQAIVGVQCSVLLLDSEGAHVRHAAAPSLPKAYCNRIDGLPVGPSAGSCGTAAYRRARVVVEDVSTDPLWAEYKDFTLSFGLAACASVPIQAGPEQAVLGTFAIYHREPGPFDEAELRLLESMQDLAVTAIINDRREQAFRQMQKDESLAVLAGGIAHDFNNLLTIIAGRASLLKAALQSDRSLALPLQDIETAVERAVGLTHQLLAFAGKVKLEMEPVQLNRLLEGMARLFTVTVSKKITLELDLAAGLPCIEADATQLQQVALNLVTNASEAIGDHQGRIRISTRAVRLGVDAIRRRFADQALNAGLYVVLEVEDNGPGIPPKVSSRIFEPFFTTKPSGRGLGLAAMLGILRSHHGGIEVDTGVDSGTRFKLFFPVSESVRMAAGSSSAGDAASAEKMGRTVLLVDDESTVLEVTRGMLEHLGYKVLTVNSGNEAVEALTANAANVAWVLMDLKMPGPDGREVAAIIRERWPAIDIVLSSGDENEFKHGDAAQGFRFLKKPYTLPELEQVLSRTSAPV